MTQSIVSSPPSSDGTRADPCAHYICTVIVHRCEQQFYYCEQLNSVNNISIILRSLYGRTLLVTETTY